MRRLFVAAAIVLAAATPAAAAPRLEPLRAERGADPAIVDTAGRQVLLRGVNVNQLGDYYRANPALDPVVPLTEADFDEMAALGFDVVRLIVHWSALEPERGAFDEAYVARIRQAVDWARARGIYTVLDMHQDAWGKYVATPPDERCLPGFTPNNGWDGAPQWATLTDGLPTCKLSLRELSPAVAQAFESFWLDRDGIQARLVETWAGLAREFAADPAVAGYDLLNEPNPGWTPEATNVTLMGRFYDRAIRAIRTAEASVPGGFAHIAFFEPSAVWSATAVEAVPLPGFTADANVVFAPHVYAGSLTVDGVGPREGHALADTVAKTYATDYWSGEWGWFGDPSEDEPAIAEYARAEDRRLAGGAWWDWKQACGDPHVVPAPGAEPGALSPSLNRFACPEQRPLGIPESTRRILSRAYVRAAPGRLTALESDPYSGALRVAGRDPDPAGSCELVVWVPGGETPSLAARGVDGLTANAAPGGWIVTGCAHGAYELTRAA